jgi:hypothetical protein
MRGLVKTLFGDARHVLVVAACIGITVLLRHIFLAPAAVILFPVMLLAGAAYLAKH